MRIGIIGYGNRIATMSSYLKILNSGAVVTALADPAYEDKQDLLKQNHINPDTVAYYKTAEEMLEKESLDGVMIGTRCSLHAKLGTMVLERNLPLFLEKPIATNMEDLKMLKNAGMKTSAQAVISFPLRVTPLVDLAKEIINSGEIGTVEHVQAWNNVPYGLVYYMNWYRDENETQGLWLQKATHDFDYINHILGYEPKMICAMMSKQIFKGDHPAGLKCDECDEQKTCPESPWNIFWSKKEKSAIEPSGLKCAFAVDTGNEDSGSAIILYDTGMHAVYSQNFFARKNAGKRGARFLGYKGTLEFDWYTNKLIVHKHHKPITETIDVDPGSSGHGGGDAVLMQSFIDIVKGEGDSVAPLSAGLQSALICLKAKTACLTHSYQKIEWD